MNKTDNSDEFLLSMVFIGVIMLLTIPCYIINDQWLSINPWFFWSVVLLPLISILVAMILSGNTFRIFGKLPYIKYRPRLPLFFYYDEKPDKYRYRECDKLQSLIQDGDVLLRRHDYYIDGLILLQNAYYSHAGIAFKDKESGKVKVYHALGATGVTDDLLENFSRCDDLAVLRFNPNKDLGPYLKKHSNNAFFKNDKKGQQLVSKIKNPQIRIPNGDKKTKMTFDMKNVRDLVASNELRLMIHEKPANEVELRIFDDIYENIQTGNYKPPTADVYIPIVLELAEQSKGTPYDYDFNFQNFKTMSCVEFVWFCYKSLFPIHQVKRRIFTYFGFIRTFVLVPDLFAASPAFDLVYSGIEGIGTNKKKLLQYIKRTRVRFWNFILIVVFCQFTLLFAFAGIAYSLSNKYPAMTYLLLKK